MRRKNTFIPTLIALTAACTASQSLQAQSTSGRQAFPWSSSRAAQTASRVSNSMSFSAEAATETFSNPIRQLSHTSIVDSTSFDNATGSVTSIANNAMVVGETVYLDERGNKITREQLQAKLSAGQNEMISTLPSASGAVESFEQNVGQAFQQHGTPLRSIDNSAWGKAKSVTSKATSFWKKPSLFKAPEGITLPSMKTTWAKPKFDQPTTWFSRKTLSPITFASIDSLPRKGKIPTSIDQPLTAPRQLANQASKRFSPTSDVTTKSDFAMPSSTATGSSFAKNFSPISSPSTSSNSPSTSGSSTRSEFASDSSFAKNFSPVSRSSTSSKSPSTSGFSATSGFSPSSSDAADSIQSVFEGAKERVASESASRSGFSSRR